MAQLAIKGHSTRGKEVIEILEMLGGKNVANYDGSNTKSFYFINNIIICSSYGSGKLLGIDCYTLEKFLEKFPYKVGDKVQHKGATSCGSVFEVEKMRWEENTVKYTLRLFGCNYKTCTLPAEYLQPYKEETMDKVNEAVFDTNAQCCDIMNKLQNTNNPKLNLSQLNAISFITGTFANISNYDAINEADIYEILDKTATKYLEHIPYVKAKELIRLVTELKDIIKTI